MITQLLSSEDYDPADRFDAWCELARSMPIQHRISSEHTADFRFTLRTVRLGPTAVAHTRVLGLHAVRTSRLIRQDDNGSYELVMCTNGGIGTEQMGVEYRAGLNQWALYDSSRPYSMRSLADVGSVHSAVALVLPKSSLGLPDAEVPPLLSRPLPGGTGMGAVIGDTLARVFREAHTMQPTHAHRFGGLLQSLAAALFAQELSDSDHRLPEEGHRQVLRMRIRSFTLSRLADPALTPGVIAAAHHISVGYLHRIFRPDGRTIAAWIREQRLERACRDLADPSQRTTPVHVIAARWGFRHPADFSRAFRRVHGMPPRDYREETLG
ncbi:AraC family transcriptional regulator [Streptomyces sp. NPDC017638]|uniref:AraC family transcriptional regulator n=1 Tax=Streptomyces sp. NPDC017638 TaxID=3365004 RepID=UPI0037B8F1EA